MLKDAPRTEAYQKAILGNKELFEGKVIMDIGAGTGKTNVKLIYIHYLICAVVQQRRKPTIAQVAHPCDDC